MYSKKYPALNPVTPSRVFQPTGNLITPLASALEKPELFTASTNARSTPLLDVDLLESLESLE